MPSEHNAAFYDAIADSYHLIYEDWQETIERQSAIIARLLASPSEAGAVLDCACGIGTQSLGLATAGFAVEGSDLSKAQVARARIEAQHRNLRIDFRVDDMRTLAGSAVGRYGAVLAFDNAIPHLDSDDDIAAALCAMHDRLFPGGKLLISLRDYAPLITQRPTMMPPHFFGVDGERRIIHQVWEWHDGRHYTVHVFMSLQTPGENWDTRHFVGRYRAITLDEVVGLVKQVGFEGAEILSPTMTGFYQPIVGARRRL